MRGSPTTTAEPSSAPGTLGALIAAGNRLIRAAAMIGDEDDFHSWRLQRNAWVRSVANALAGDDVRGLAERFAATARVERPLTSWHMAIPGEVRAVQDAVAALESAAGG